MERSLFSARYIFVENALRRFISTCFAQNIYGRDIYVYILKSLKSWVEKSYHHNISSYHTKPYHASICPWLEFQQHFPASQLVNNRKRWVRTCVKEVNRQKSEEMEMKKGKENYGVMFGFQSEFQAVTGFRSSCFCNV